MSQLFFNHTMKIKRKWMKLGKGRPQARKLTGPEYVLREFERLDRYLPTSVGIIK